MADTKEIYLKNSRYDEQDAIAYATKDTQDCEKRMMRAYEGAE